jgi:Family of unknown function (DUF6165)
MTIAIQVSYGELMDKISILEIKVDRISDRGKHHNILHELSALNLALESIQSAVGNTALAALRENLKRTNEQLWEIEDAIRDKERGKVFDGEFIELARSVYKVNDQRSHLKKQIDVLLGSRLTEEKSYQPY